jgi:hypothetical protein
MIALLTSIDNSLQKPQDSENNQNNAANNTIDKPVNKYFQ